MIRLVYFLRRRQGLSLHDFQSYWRESHGPLVASHATHLGLLRYVQSHTLEDPIDQALSLARGGAMEPPFDGVADLWWATEDDLSRALASAPGRRAGAELLADEAHFIDLPRSPLHLAFEYPQINPAPENLLATPRSDLLKICFPLRHLATLAEPDARRYWLSHHGPVIRSHAQGSGILRYLQVHRVGHALDAGLREARGTAVEPYLGHAEVWVSRTHPQTPEGAAASRAAVEDETRFIDFGRSCLWACKEHSIVDRR
jgi:hypothetical protein